MSDFRTYLFSSFVGNSVGPIYAVLLPLFAYQLGASILEIGIVGGISSSIYAFVPFFAGTYSDRLRSRHAFIVVSLVFLVLSSTLYTLASSPTELILFRIFEGLGWAIFWPTLDIIVSEEKGRDPKHALTQFNVTLSAASIVGPIIGGLIVVTFAEIRYVFFVTTLLLLATLVMNSYCMLRRTRDPEQPVVVEATTKTTGIDDQDVDAVSIAEERRRARAAQRQGPVLMLIVVLIFLSAIRGVLFTFLPSLGQSIGVPYLLDVSVAFAFGAGRTLSFALRLNDGLGAWIFGPRTVNRNVLIFLSMGTLGGVLPLEGNTSGSVFVAAMALSGIATAALTGMVQIELIANVERWTRGRGAGLLESSIGLGMAAGPILVSSVSGTSLSAPFAIVPIGLVVVLPVTLYLMLQDRRSVS